MTAHSFDHERLDLYRLAIEFVAVSFEASESLDGRHRARFGGSKVLVSRSPVRSIRLKSITITSTASLSTSTSTSTRL
jgi:hypothetical protein